MNTIQIVLSDLTYARTLEALSLRDGHAVTVRDSPDLNLDGAIVLDASWLDRIQCSLRPDRFIVITSRRAPINQIDLWAAGIRQVVYWEDSIAEVHLAIVAAALGLTNREGLMRDVAI